MTSTKNSNYLIIIHFSNFLLRAMLYLTVLVLLGVSFYRSSDSLKSIDLSSGDSIGIQSCGRENWLMRSEAGGSLSPIFYPWMVAIGNNSLKSFCGGAIINNHQILTAAHCVDSADALSTLRIVVGTDDILQAKESDRLVPNSLKIHPKFKKNDNGVYEHDLAILEIMPLTFAPNIQQICLNPFSEIVGKVAKVLGWGSVTQDDSGMSLTLQELSLNIKPNSECSNIWGFEVDNNYICMGETMQNVCHGDDGGPLMMYDTHSDHWNLVGVVTAYGPNCGDDHPALYTSILEHLNWIRSA